MSRVIYKGEPTNLSVQFASNPLEPYAKDYTDVTDIYMGLKLDTAEDADDAYLQKLQSDNPAGVILNTDSHTFVMVISEDDYENLEPDTYQLVLAVKVLGLTNRIELRMENSEITIEPDKSRA